MQKQRLKAPFPAIGGKSRAAGLVWPRIGEVTNYIEPFCYSAAMLLLRPDPTGAETINDLNHYVANFWRAVQKCPEIVAHFADWPVNEVDLHSRHKWLVRSEEAKRFREGMRNDPEYFDPKIAGWWVWGQCCWIGSGWCQVTDDPAVMRRPEAWNQKPHLAGWNGSQGINQRPVLEGRGVLSDKALCKMPDISGHNGGTGRGVNMKRLDNADHRKRPRAPRDSYGTLPGVTGRPQLADAYSRGRGVHGNDQAETCRERREWLLQWMQRLQDRLRAVRICCGHWRRVCDSRSVTTRLGKTFLFLDPPYPIHGPDGKKSRASKLYATDTGARDLDRLRDEVLAYCLERGGDPDLLIAVCGYDTDGYSELKKQGWKQVSWKANGGYGNRGGKGSANAKRERIWFSPHCIDPDALDPQRRLFEVEED